MEPVITQPTDGESLKMYETEEGSINLSWYVYQRMTDRPSRCGGDELTATFFWDRTTAQFLPFTPIEVMLAEVIALKAYSKRRGHQW